MQEEEITIETNDGLLDCRLFINKNKNTPSIIFYMDAPAIREELRIMCRRLCKNGYNVVLPNLFYRVGTEGNYPFNQGSYKTQKKELKKMITTMNNTTNSMITKDTKFILDYIENNFPNNKNIGIVGYCMSGRFVVTCGAIYPEKISAIASFYGVDIFTNKSDSPHLLADKIKGELYLAFAEKDIWVPNKVLEKIKISFSNTYNKVTVETYKGTNHGFAFPSRHSYIEKAAEKHWENLILLFERNLKSLN
ncbi:MAG: hypothetical protein CFH34_01542 [Alphaproteobacteria bacterium MarineAlpha9_Bin4]|nr:hydrolase [Pelagibacterales bacterium]PPR25214.1 MAG: hypothetical protein CFH34_01542 [Alphaproteobacteria bacterium MarineAlpha9_Bin4]